MVNVTCAQNARRNKREIWTDSLLLFYISIPLPAFNVFGIINKWRCVVILINPKMLYVNTKE